MHAHGAQATHGHARLEAAEEPGQLVADQAIGLREREPPDPEVADLRQQDAPVPVDGADQGTVHRAPDVDRQIVAGAEHVVGSDGNVVDRRERRHVGREHRVAVLAQRRTEGAKVGLLDADGVQVVAGLDAGELVEFGHRHRRAGAECPRLGRRLQTGLRGNARSALRHGDLRHRAGGLLHRRKRLGRPCPWNRNRLIRPPAGLAYVQWRRAGGALDDLRLRGRKRQGWLLGRGVGSRRALAGEHPAVAAVRAAQRGHERLAVPGAGGLPEGRRHRERQIRAQQGPERHGGDELPRSHCPTP